MRNDKNTLQLIIAMAVVGIVALFAEPSGFGDGASQCWTGLVGAALSAVGGVTSALVGNAQAKRAQEEREKAKAELQNWYTTNMNTNVLDRADTMSVLKAYRDTLDEQNRKYHTNAIKGGASEEAKVAYAQQANKAYSDAISKIMAQGQQRKDQVTDAYMQGMMGLYNNDAERYMQNGKQMSNVISSSFNSMGDALAGSTLGKKD